MTKTRRVLRTKPTTHRFSQAPRQISTAALVSTLRSRGVRLTAAGNNLYVDAPRGTLDEVDQQRLWDRLEEVCAILNGSAGNVVDQSA